MARDKYMILNGEQCLWQPIEEPYVYQTIHTLGHKCRFTAQHIDVLNIAAKSLFGTTLRQTPQAIERQARELLEANHITHNATVGIRIIFTPQGDYCLECGEVTLYAGYTLRILRPTAMYVAAAVPWPSLPTSALLSTRKVIEAVVRERDIQEAIITDPQGKVISDATRPIIIINGYEATISPSMQHLVESRLAIEAFRKIGLKVSFADSTIDALQSADEILYVTYQGITSIARIGRRSYMNILAENIAEAMEEIYQSDKNIIK